jgi:hypothetical protein
LSKKKIEKDKINPARNLYAKWRSFAKETQFQAAIPPEMAINP